MQLIRAFILIVEELGKKPSFFWDKDDKQELLSAVATAVATLKKPLKEQALTETQAYKQLVVIQESISQVDFQETAFLSALSNLLDIYIVAAAIEEAETLSTIQANVQKVKMENLAYHLSLEKLAELSKTMDMPSRENHDRDVIKNVGSLYVVENLLRVLAEFIHSTDEQKWKLLKEGVQSKNFGKIPAYLALEEKDRDQLCYQIYSDTFRVDLLRAFYAEEEMLRTNQLKPICLAIKQLTCDLLRLFQKTGIEKYHGVMFAPFGNDIPIEDLIAKIEEITF